MLIRSITKKLVAWKSRSHHPLVIAGLRQTGKTFSVRAFGESNYGHVVYLDLRANKAVRAAFSGDFDVDKMVLSITANVADARFVPNDTILILDEVQDCADARSSLKYWDLDGRYDVIATGSFLGVKGFREPYPRGIPVGYEEHLTMRPLDFVEFAANMGISDEVLQYARETLLARDPLLPAVHAGLQELYHQYLIVGGMPEAVNTFLEAHDLNAVRDVQRGILASIRDDFGRYKNTKGEDAVNTVLKLRAEACLDSLPTQLSKEYKKFQYSKVNVSGNSPQKADGLQYLVDVGLVVKSYNLREISSPLESQKKANEFKVFFADTGLLVSQLEQGTAAHILDGDLSSYKGAVAENMVASALASAEKELFYLRAPSGSPELDFVVNLNGKPTILECKASNGRATSMRYVLKNPKKYGAHPAIKLAATNVGGGEGFVTLPSYALGFIGMDEEMLIAPTVSISLE
ncbi:MAG: ATP-binding protein [Atopobiaceae bacterium]|nr:ATP-binding protein [Atopobiaceae bacterium]